MKIILFISFYFFLSFGIAQNLVDTSPWDNWTVGSPIPQGFSNYASSQSSSINIEQGPFEEQVPIWSTTASGGFRHNGLQFDKSKTYRVSLWMKKGVGVTCNNYFGIDQYVRPSIVEVGSSDLDLGNDNSFIYFYKGTNFPVEDKWYLVTAYIHPNDYNGSDMGGVYDPVNGAKVLPTNDKKFIATTGDLPLGELASYTYNCTYDGKAQSMYGLRVEEINGNEPSLEDLLTNNTSNTNNSYISHWEKVDSDVSYLEGNVGIGTTTPTAKLHISNSNSIALSNLSNSSVLLGTNDVGLGLDTNEIIAKGTDLNIGAISSGKDIRFRAGGTTDRMFIEGSNGNVGIGTTTPSEKLHVKGGTATIEGDIGTPTSNYWKTGNHSLELQNNDAGDVVLSFHRGGKSNAAITHTTKGGLTFTGAGRPSDEHMYISTIGNIGIGTTTPTQKLDVKNGHINTNKNYLLNNGQAVISIRGNRADLYKAAGAALSYYNGTNVIQGLVLNNLGNVGIGTTDIPSEYKLAVTGKVITEEVKVQLQSQWPDYVFKHAYQLPTLEQVETHIEENGHLENIPSAEEVAKDGFFLGAMDAKLLQKIEELTLYTIQQEKKIKKLETQNTELKVLSSKLYELTKRLELLESN